MTPIGSESNANLSQDESADALASRTVQVWTADAVAELFESYRDRLQRCVANWIPQALLQKLSADDVLQEAAIAAIRHPEKMSTLEVLPFVWFRSLARDAMNQRLRLHLGTAKRTMT